MHKVLQAVQSLSRNQSRYPGLPFQCFCLLLSAIFPSAYVDLNLHWYRKEWVHIPSSQTIWWFMQALAQNGAGKQTMLWLKINHLQLITLDISFKTNPTESSTLKVEKWWTARMLRWEYGTHFWDLDRSPGVSHSHLKALCLEECLQYVLTSSW